MPKEVLHTTQMPEGIESTPAERVQHRLNNLWRLTELLMEHRQLKEQEEGYLSPEWHVRLEEIRSEAERLADENRYIRLGYAPEAMQIFPQMQSLLETLVEIVEDEDTAIKWPYDKNAPSYAEVHVERGSKFRELHKLTLTMNRYDKDAQEKKTTIELLFNKQISELAERGITLEPNCGDDDMHIEHFVAPPEVLVSGGRELSARL